MPSRTPEIMDRIFPPAALLAGLALVLAVAPLRAQESPARQNLRVFLDCQGYMPGCDFDFFRTSIDWVDWVRDRQDADVHVLVTTQPTGAGGQQYTLNLIGRGRFDGRSDTLTYNAAPAAPRDEQRHRLGNTMELGLAPFAARTSVAPRLRISMVETEGGEEAEAQTSPEHDPWNYWVFRINGNSFFQGESSYTFVNLGGGFSATRVTPGWKLGFRISGNYSQNRYRLSTGNTTTFQRSYYLNTLTAKSLSPHWSAGLVSSTSTSTYSNYDLTVRVAPGVEYDLFPYSESTRRQLTFLYTLGLHYYNYTEPTVFRKLEDRLVDQTLNVSLDLRQPWGSVSIGTQGTQYVNWSPGPDAPAELQSETSKYRISVFGSTSIRLVKGLSVNMFVNYDRVHDQFALPAGGATDEEILLRLRQLQTDYRYFGSIGLSYTFGSIHNNVVNPRFNAYDSGGGQTVIIN